MNIEVDPILQINDVPVVLRAVEAGLGIAGLPVMAVEDALEFGRLQIILPEWRFRRHNIWAVYGHRTSEDPTLEAFVRLLKTLDL